MEHFFGGEVIEGRFDFQANDFTITKMKNVCTETVIDKKEIAEICSVLEKNRGGQFVSINEQVFTKLNDEDVTKTIKELNQIRDHLL